MKSPAQFPGVLTDEIEIFWNSIHRACSFHQFLLLPN
jgi:hypothetical protein